MRSVAVALQTDVLDSRADILNPDTPLAWLSPRDAHIHEFLQNFWCAVAGAWTWDLLMNLGEEHRLLTNSKFTMTQLLYVLSRVTTAACVYISLAFVVAKVDDCDTLFTADAAFFCVAPLFNSLLMFLRLRAVYLDRPRLVQLFFAIWAVCGAATFATTIPAFHAMHIGDTHRCMIDIVHNIAGIGIILSAVHDTVFFVAISYRLLQAYQYGDTWRTRLRTFFGGEETWLGGVRRRGLTHALLRSGQQYYLVTVGMSIATAALPFVTHLPFEVRISLGSPYVALQNAMMCKVYRQLKLGLIVDDGIDPLSLTVNIGSSTPPAMPQPSAEQSGSGRALEAHNSQVIARDLESGCTSSAVGEESRGSGSSALDGMMRLPRVGKGQPECPSPI